MKKLLAIITLVAVLVGTTGFQIIHHNHLFCGLDDYELVMTDLFEDAHHDCCGDDPEPNHDCKDHCVSKLFSIADLWSVPPDIPLRKSVIATTYILTAHHIPFLVTNRALSESALYLPEHVPKTALKRYHLSCALLC